MHIVVGAGTIDSHFQGFFGFRHHWTGVFADALVFGKIDSGKKTLASLLDLLDVALRAVASLQLAIFASLAAPACFSALHTRAASVAASRRSTRIVLIGAAVASAIVASCVANRVW